MSLPPTDTTTDDDTAGPALALLLLGGFRHMIDHATAELAKRGHPDVRANHEFAMRAIEGGAGSAIELAGRLGLTKQAAAKTITALEARGYVMREGDPADARRKSLRITPRGREMLAQGQAVLNDVRRIWANRVGKHRLAEVEDVLQDLFGEPVDGRDAATWLAVDENRD